MKALEWIRRNWGAVTVFVGAAVVLLPWLGLTLFYSKGEPREAVVALSILRDGDWILPTYFGGEIPFKPPLLAWLIALFAKLFNGGEVNEYISRLPSALASLAMLMAGYGWARRLRGTRFAVLFCYVQLTSFEILRAAVACRLDMLLTACMVTAIYMLYDLGEGRGRLRALRYGAVVVLLTAAVMTKGPVGALLPCFIIGVYRLLRGRPFFATLGAMLGLSALAMVLPALWAYAAYLRGGSEFASLMYEENIGRLMGTMSYGSHVKPAWYNFLTLASGLLPWTLLLLMALFVVPWRRCVGYVRELPRRWRTVAPATLLAVVAATLTVLFYCIPESKRSVYLLPAYPFICYGIAGVIESARAARALSAFTWVMAVVGLVAPLGLIVCSAMHVLPGAALPLWAYVVLALPMAASLAWIVRRRRVGVVWTLWLAYVAVGMPTTLNGLSERGDAERVLARAGEADILLLQTQPKFRLYALNYYLGDRMRPVADVATASAFPPGTVVIADARGDTTGLAAAFDIEPLAESLAEFHSPIIMAVRRGVSGEQ